MRHVWLVFLLLMSPAVFGQSVEPAPIDTDTVDVPDLPDLPEPDVSPTPPEPPPTPTPTPAPITDLRAGEMFIIAHTKPCLILDSREGLVTIKELRGPRDFYGKFVNGKVRGQDEDRTYDQPYLYVVKAVKKGTVELFVIHEGVKSREDAIRRTLTVMGAGPNPPPDPDVDPDPIPDPPTPDPTPTPAKGSVLIWYESSDTSVPSSKVAQYTSGGLAKYLVDHTLRGKGNTPEYRIWDKDVNLDRVSEEWKTAVEIARQQVQQGVKMPILVVSNGGTGFAGALPATEDETIKLLSKYLGE